MTHQFNFTIHYIFHLYKQLNFRLKILETFKTLLILQLLIHRGIILKRISVFRAPIILAFLLLLFDRG